MTAPNLTLYMADGASARDLGYKVDSNPYLTATVDASGRPHPRPAWFDEKADAWARGFDWGPTLSGASYAEARAEYDALNAKADAAGAVLRAIPGVGSGPMGLTPDEVRTSQAYREAKTAAERASHAVRAFAGPFVKRFKAKYRAAIEAERVARRDARAAA